MSRLAYILAASHSGSTLLSMLLNAHPGVATVGELAPGGLASQSSYLCSCGSIIERCRFWTWLGRRARASGVPFSLEDFGTAFTMPESPWGRRLLGSLHRGPMIEAMRDACLRLLSGWTRRFASIVRSNETLVQLALEYYGARVFVDKGNLALRLKFLLRVPSFDVKVIHLVRDGRAVALAYTDSRRFADAANPALRGGGMGMREPERLPVSKAAYNVRRCLEEAEHALACLDRSRWMEVRYEDLCADPERALEGIFEFLGLDPFHSVLDFRTVEHHIIGNGMRLDNTADIRTDERWRAVLTERDLRTFDRIAGNVSRRYGYV